VNGDTFTFTESTSATATSPVGTYPIVPVATGANLGDYNVVYVNGTLTVGKANLTVTAGDASRTYGSPNPVFTATAVGAQNGDVFTFAESTPATQSSPIGTYPIVPVATGANLGNYNVTYVNGTLTVGQAILTVTAGDATRIYGSPNPAFTASAVGAVNGDTFTFAESTSATQSSPIGTYPIVPVATGANLSNYNVVYVNGTLTIGKAGLTVTAADANRTYGAANPVFTASASGAVNGDTFTFTETTTAVQSSPIGTYPIVPVATGATLGNYNVTYVNGTLTVGQARLTVTAADATRIYGSPNPVFTASAVGAVNGDTFTFTETTAAVQSSPVGTYPIVPLAAGTNLSNYTVTYINGTLTVAQASLTVTAGNAGRVYGVANPAFTANAIGAVNGDTFTLAESTPATITSPVGNYPIVPVATGANLADYNLTYVNGTLTIGQATPVITWPVPMPISYDTALSSTQLDATASVAGTFAYSPAAGAILPAGSNKLTVLFTPTDTINYTTQTASVNLVVLAAAPVINWNNPASIVYGTPLSATQLNATAVQPTGTGAVDGTFVYTPALGTVLSVGTQPISVIFTPTDSLDYTKVTKTVSINVTAATLVLTANDATKVYGTVNPTFTGTVTGAQNGDVILESFTTTALTLSDTGTYPIIPSVSGVNVPNYAQTVNNGTLTITKASVVSTLTLSTNSIAYDLPVTMTLALKSATSGTPTGTVSFFDNGNLIGTATIANNIATFTTTSLAVGNHVISTLYSGDKNFNAQTAGASSGTSSVFITPLDFNFQLTSPSSLHGVYGTSGTYTFHVSPIGGMYPGTVQFTVNGLHGPVLATYTFSPNTLAMMGGPSDITLTVSTRKLAEMDRPDLSKLSPIALGLFLIPLAATRRFRKSGRKLARAVSLSVLLLLTLGGIASLTGCGSGYAAKDDPIVVIATSNGITHTVAINYHIDASKQ
jgi:hypothetical protein